MASVCTTVECVSRAVQNLAHAEYVILECEGRKQVGFNSGLSLISVGTPNAENVYLFDALTLSKDALRPLFESILSSGPSAGAKTKVVWDCRMDYVELLRNYDFTLENVLDLQLVDIHSRFQRGEFDDDNRRLFRFIRRDFPLPAVRKLQLRGVHVLNSIDHALSEHGIEGVRTRRESLNNLYATNVNNIRMKRPIPKELVDYAVDDIKRISKVYDHFLERGYLTRMDYLRDLSARYSAMHRQVLDKSETLDVFSKAPYLPLSIPMQAKPTRQTPETKECSECKLMIPERLFPFERAPREERKYVSRTSTCKVCTLLAAREEHAERRKEKAGKAESVAR